MVWSAGPQEGTITGGCDATAAATDGYFAGLASLAEDQADAQESPDAARQAARDEAAAVAAAIAEEQAAIESAREAAIEQHNGQYQAAVAVAAMVDSQLAELNRRCREAQPGGLETRLAKPNTSQSFCRMTAGPCGGHRRLVAWAPAWARPDRAAPGGLPGDTKGGCHETSVGPAFCPHRAAGVCPSGCGGWTRTAAPTLLADTQEHDPP